MKSRRMTVWLVMVLALSACAPLASPTLTPTVPPTLIPTVLPTAVPTLTPTVTPADLTLKTAIGDLVVASARRVDEANGTQAGAGEKILLVLFTQPGGAKLSPDTLSLEAVQTALQDTSKGQVHITLDTGAEAICTMAGWVGEDFAMGFRVPETAKTYTLFWPGNAPLAVVPEN